MAEIVRETIIAGLVAAFLDGLKNGLRKTSEQIPEELKKRLEEHRSEMFAFLTVELGGEDPAASSALTRRQMERQKCEHKSYPDPDRTKNEKWAPGDEDHYIHLLTKLYMHLSHTEEEKAIRLAVFKELGNLDDEQADTILEILAHDAVLQWLKKAWKWLEKSWGKIWGWISSHWPAVRAFLKSGDVYAAQEIWELNGRLQRRHRGWFSNFLYWLGS